MKCEPLFLFDLDGTITKKEILPEISREVGLYEQISKLTYQTMHDNIPFYEGFTARVNLLKDISVTRIQEIVADIPLNNEIVGFLRENKNRCRIVTGNIDVWIEKLMERIGVGFYSSKASVLDDKVDKLTYVMDKSRVVRELQNQYVAIGDGSNDFDMILGADIGIAFGGINEPPSSILSIATHAIYEEAKLCEFLKRLL